MMLLTCTSAKRWPMQRWAPPPNGTQQRVCFSSSAEDELKRSVSGHHSVCESLPARQLLPIEVRKIP